MTKRGSLLLAVAVGPVGFVAGMSLAERPDPRPLPLSPPAPVTSSTLPEPTGLATFSTLASLPPGEDSLAPTLPMTTGSAAREEETSGREAPLPPGALPQLARTDPLSELVHERGGDRRKRAALYAQLASHCESREFKEEAARFRQAALALNPSNLQLIDAVAKSDPHTARSLLLALIRHQPTEERLRRLADLDPGAARGALLTALDASPSDSALLRLLAELAPGTALPRIDAGLRANPEVTDLFYVLAELDPTAAVGRIEARLQSEPDDWTLLDALATAYESLGNPGAVASRIEAALAATTDPESQIELIELLARVDAAGAISRWEALGKPHDDEDPYTLRSIGLAYFQAGRMSEGMALAGQIIEMENAMDGGSDYLSSLLEEAPAAGLQLARSLLQANPDDMHLRGDLLYALQNTDQEEEASRLATRWVEEATTASVLRSLSNYLSEMELPGDPHIRAWKRTYELDPRSVEPIRALIDYERADLALQLIGPLARANPDRRALRYLVRSALHSVADCEPAQLLSWLDRFPTLPLSSDVDYLMALAESAGNGELGVQVARKILKRALRVANPEEAEDVRALDSEFG